MNKNIKLANEAGVEAALALRLVINHLEEAIAEFEGAENLPERLDTKVRLLHAKTALSYLDISLK